MTKTIWNHLYAAAYGHGRVKRPTNDHSSTNSLDYGWCTGTFPRDARIPTVWDTPTGIQAEEPNKTLCEPFSKGLTSDNPSTGSALATDPSAEKAFTAKLQNLFTDKLRQQLGQSSVHRVLVFVHGYNVTFYAGAKTAAHLAYDLGFSEPLVYYSWPSQGSVIGYAADEDSVWWSAYHFKDFVTMLASTPGVDEIDILAHSMGSRAVALVLGQLLTDTAIKRKCREVAFVAADIDSDIFRNLADGFALNPSTKVTLYASSRDRVLKVSEWVTVDSRAGQVQGGKGKQGTPLVFPEINSIDASAVDKGFLGHSYYDNPTMLADLFDLFTYDQYPSGKYRRDCNRKYTLLQPPDEPEWNCAVKAGSDQKGPSTSAISGGPAADER